MIPETQADKLDAELEQIADDVLAVLAARREDHGPAGLMYRLTADDAERIIRLTDRLRLIAK